MQLKPGDRLVMIGDSITEWGRPRAGAPDHGTALGHGYVSKVAARLKLAIPAPGVVVFNRGIGGHTVRDLELRWDVDVSAMKANWLSLMIGINDVWRFFDPLRQAEAVPPEEYERTLDALVSRTRAQVRGLVIMTPFYVEPDRSDPMRRRMDQFGAIAAKVAAGNGSLLVDTQALMDGLLRTASPEAVAHDRVHVGDAGHEALAQGFLEAVA